MMDDIRRDFRDRSDATLISYWNEGNGSLSWNIALEETLRVRGYKTRDENGMPREIPVPGDKHD